jgi:hypothetical protein
LEEVGTSGLEDCLSLEGLVQHLGPGIPSGLRDRVRVRVR